MTTETKYCVVLSTVSSVEDARKIARKLVEKRLAACVNIVAGIRSIYEWEGKITEDSEVMMIIKTRAEILDGAIDEISKNHPYDVPEILALPVMKGNQAFFEWIDSVTSNLSVREENPL